MIPRCFLLFVAAAFVLQFQMYAQLRMMLIILSLAQSITLALHSLGKSSKILRIVVLQASLAPFSLSFSLLPLAPAFDFDSHCLKGFLCLIRGISLLLVTSKRVRQFLLAISPCNFLASFAVSRTWFRVTTSLPPSTRPKTSKCSQVSLFPPVCDRFQSLASLYFFFKCLIFLSH